MDSSAKEESVGQAERPDTGNEDAEAHDSLSEDDGQAGIKRVPHEIAVLPVRRVVIFPGTIVPLTIGREKSKRLIDAVLAGEKLVAVFTQRDESVEDPGIEDVYRVGTIARVLKLLQMPDGSHSLLVHGVSRIGLERFVETEPYWKAIVNPHQDDPGTSLETEALAHSARRSAEQVIELSQNVPDEARTMLANIDKPGPLADFLAANLSLGLVQKQELLETFDIADRLRKVNVTLNNQLEVLQLSNKIQTDVRQQIDSTQRKYFLHEQLKAIQKELGEDDGQQQQMAELRKRIDAAAMPEVVLKEANRELDRLQRISQNSPEHGVIRDYLDWLCDMPWQHETKDKLDLARAERILDEDHYGLEKIKRRILEYLAVRKLKPDGKGPILCFHGPPGVGKTSLGKSIARALGRKFIRIALGGVRDEADIRGHRRTYIGAIPGRIVQEIRKAGSRNPVVMLDELDKLGADFRGDPASALLEVLDPEQNHTFTDHYLSVPFDLSHVLFIGTANYMDPVAPALLDRMEILGLAGYTTAEKMEIAKRYLVKRQLDQNGLTGRKIKFEDDSIRTIIENHTREAGVRNLERLIGSVCRGIAAKVARKTRISKVVRPEDLQQYLGAQRFERETALDDAPAGVATGLAYTPVGGDLIFIEALAMPGRGGFQLTGQIGDVMRESAQAALSLVRSRAARWGISLENLPDVDLHVHVPAGGIPKDGPSAGVAIVSALLSLILDTPVRRRLGMTGEITLSGRVLPIGGLKEKLLAAHRAGLDTIILPDRNQPDLDEVPQDVRDDLKLIFAKRIEDVIEVALPEALAVGKPKPRRGTIKAKRGRAATRKAAAAKRGKTRKAAKSKKTARKTKARRTKAVAR